MVTVDFIREAKSWASLATVTNGRLPDPVGSRGRPRNGRGTESTVDGPVPARGSRAGTCLAPSRALRMV